MSNWIPEICYEEPDESTGENLSSHIPFIQVPENEVMPGVLFIFESRETGEFEPDIDGHPLQIVEMDLAQYCNMATLKNNLDEATYDTVRRALGLEPLTSAAIKGRKITQNIRDKVEN